VNLSIELDREDDGRWIAEALELPGVMAYGENPGRGHQQHREAGYRGDCGPH
jgi:hypothetical protein